MDIVDINVEHLKAWKAGDFEQCAVLLREAKALVGDRSVVRQMGDGALQLVPVEE